MAGCRAGAPRSHRHSDTTVGLLDGGAVVKAL